MKKAGITNLTFHDLRGIFTTLFAYKGLDMLALQRVLGHQNIQTTMRYAQPFWQSIEKSVNAVGAIFNNINANNALVEIFFDSKNV